MSSEIVTKEDLEKFREDLLRNIQELLYSKGFGVNKPWLKNAEVKKLLGVSSNTIQRLRINGKLNSTKVGGIHYYRYEDIVKLLNSGTIN